MTAEELVEYISIVRDEVAKSKEISDPHLKRAFEHLTIAMNEIDFGYIRNPDIGGGA